MKVQRKKLRIMAWSTVVVIVVTIIAVILAMCLTGTSADNKLKEIFKWKLMDFDYPSPEMRNDAIKQNKFVPLNSLPLGIEVWNDKVFITTPRWKSGIPASLSYVPLNAGTTSPPLRPFPDWETHDISSPPYDKKIINPLRVRADECDRLWVMDTGVNDILEKAQPLTPPKIMVFDLKNNNTLLRVFPFPLSCIKEDTFFANIIIDVDKNKCDDAYAYVPDFGSYALVVYDWANNNTWRIKHNYFYLDPLSGDYNIQGINFQWADGIFSIAMGPRDANGHRTLYFHPLSSTREFSVSSRIIQNETLASNSYHEFHVLGSRGPNTQATASFMDPETGVLLYTQINRNGIACWNSKKEYSADTNHLLASDSETMIFPNDLKIDRNGNVWFTTDRLPAYVFNEMKADDDNFRVFTGSVKDLVKGTVCEN